MNTVELNKLRRKVDRFLWVETTENETYVVGALLFNKNVLRNFYFSEEELSHFDEIKKLMIDSNYTFEKLFVLDKNGDQKVIEVFSLHEGYRDYLLNLKNLKFVKIESISRTNIAKKLVNKIIKNEVGYCYANKSTFRQLGFTNAECSVAMLSSIFKYLVSCGYTFQLLHVENEKGLNIEGWFIFLDPEYKNQFLSLNKLKEKKCAERKNIKGNLFITEDGYLDCDFEDFDKRADFNLN